MPNTKILANGFIKTLLAKVFRNYQVMLNMIIDLKIDK